jgi:hypothetical protein
MYFREGFAPTDTNFPFSEGYLRFLQAYTRANLSNFESIDQVILTTTTAKKAFNREDRKGAEGPEEILSRPSRVFLCLLCGQKRWQIHFPTGFESNL